MESDLRLLSYMQHVFLLTWQIGSLMELGLYLIHLLLMYPLYFVPLFPF